MVKNIIAHIIFHLCSHDMPLVIDKKIAEKLQDGQQNHHCSKLCNLPYELCHHGPEDIVISIIKFVGAFIILLSVNFKLTLLLFAVIPLMFVFAYIMKGRMNRAFRKNRENIAQINAQIEDNLSGIRVVKSFANEECEKQKFREGNGEFVKSKSHAYWQMATFHSGLSFFTSMINVVVIVGGGLLIAGNGLQVSDLLNILRSVVT